ncbi:hypothetical protein DEI87_03230 [Curtobacterium sp. MCBD17_029]|nr:hypothetical protein DEI87_03230 [Curtobacterium sp. MCBD17_029]PYY59821.1 hypothetical protein DEJ26_07995 [Curtobacterium sp. MCPF17_015]
MAKRISPETGRRLFAVLGFVGLVVFLAAVVLIALDPSRPAPYFTAVSGLCVMISAVIVFGANRRPSKR